MSKYLIHCCNNRRWYVDKYLIPSVLKQGISESDISIYQDTENEGCLISCMKAFKNIGYNDGTWHLQDDVVIADNFKELTEKYNTGIVCAMCTDYDINTKCGAISTVDEMWYSFPCIRIPNNIARACGEWFFREARYDERYRPHWKRNKDDDVMFRYFLKQHEPVTAMNLYPNIVNHIDYLLGGSTINTERDKRIVAKYWQDNTIIERLEQELQNEHR